jgi:hydroxyethylthiazole kinase
VGAGATGYRTGAARDLLKTGKVSVIRGNASEIIALVSAGLKTKGVESTESADNAIVSAEQVQRDNKCVVCVSGKIDYIISHEEIAEIHNGHEMMTRITGMGCAATALIGAFAGVMDNYFEAAVSGMALMGVAGELAAAESSGPASLELHFIDKLHNISSREFFNTIKMKINRYV